MDKLDLLQRHALNCAIRWDGYGITTPELMREALRRWFLHNYLYLPHPDYINEIVDMIAF